jgi:hypothetical protein
MPLEIPCQNGKMFFTLGYKKSREFPIQGLKMKSLQSFEVQAF